MNNYEKIKNMTLDEMAEFIFNTYFPCSSKRHCVNCSMIIQDFCELTNDYKNKAEMKQWLQQESE